MAQRKTRAVAEEQAEQERSPLFKGHRKVSIYLKDAQAEALVAEARRRSDERGAMRSDVSEVVREAVDLWMAKSGKR